MTEQLFSIEKALPILIAIFFVVLLAIIVIRLVLSFLLYQAIKRYEKLRIATQKIGNSARSFGGEGGIAR